MATHRRSKEPPVGQSEHSTQTASNAGSLTGDVTIRPIETRKDGHFITRQWDYYSGSSAKAHEFTRGMKRVSLIIKQYEPFIAEFRARTKEPAVWNGGSTGSAQNRTVWSPFPSLSVTANNGRASSELPPSWVRSVTAEPHDFSRGRSQFGVKGDSRRFPFPIALALEWIGDDEKDIPEVDSLALIAEHDQVAVGSGIAAVRSQDAVREELKPNLDTVTPIFDAYDGPLGWLSFSAVDTAWRGLGIGYQLFTRRFEWLCERTSVILSIGWEHSTGRTSRPLFEQAGFIDVVTIDDFYSVGNSRRNNCPVCNPNLPHGEYCVCPATLWVFDNTDSQRIRARLEDTAAGSTGLTSANIENRAGNGMRTTSRSSEKTGNNYE